jgi:hypothetical protein
VFAQQSITPLKILLKQIDTLIFRGSPTNNKGFRYDTLYAEQVDHLAKVRFKNKKINMDKYGVTPDGSISLYQ